MSAARFARSAPRFAAQLRAPTQRRFASGAAQNEFIAERQHIKEHAKESTELWKKISIYGVIPCLAIAAANAYWLWNDHWEHWSHMPPLEERPEYSYQNIRTKNYQWGNGDKTLLYVASDDSDGRGSNPVMLNEIANYLLTNSWNDKVNYHNKDKV